MREYEIEPGFMLRMDNMRCLLVMYVMILYLHGNCCTDTSMFLTIASIADSILFDTKTYATQPLRVRVHDPQRRRLLFMIATTDKMQKPGFDDDGHSDDGRTC